MLRRRLAKNATRVVLVAAAALFGAIAAGGPYSDYFTRYGYDLLLPAVRPLTASRDPEPSRVVLIAEDEITHNVPPFDMTPDEAWSPQIAEVLQDVAVAEPAVVGFDIIFPKALGTRALMPGFDVSLLRAMRLLANDDRIILGYLDISTQKIIPNDGHVSAVRGEGNLRQNFVYQDLDSITRAYPVVFERENAEGFTPSFGAELAIRAGADLPARKDSFLIDFRAMPAFEIYRLADLYDCAQNGDLSPFDELTDKVVLFGTQLDVEDRHLAANRYLDRKTVSPKELPCAPERPAYEERESDTMPGVYLHMHAIDQMLDDRYIAIIPAWERALIGGAVSGAFALAFLFLSPTAGVLALVGGAGAAYGGGILALFAGTLIPWALWSGSNVFVYVGAFAYRVLIEGKEKRTIRNAFQHYLAPELVAQVADNPDSLRLGGERREAAIFFSDLAGFTTLSEKLKDEPETLVEVTNMNLAMVADAIERNGGYVDKFIGDAVMAVWGAPAFVENKATRAALAAIEAIDGLKDTNARKPRADLPDINMRVGLNWGTVIAGNMGSERRLNYTIVGDAVNLAARLEPACNVYGVRILAGEELAQRVDETVVTRCVDYVAVKGKSEPVKVYEIAGKADSFPEKRLAAFQRFAEGLDMFWSRRFEEAERLFRELADDDPVAKVYVDRARRFREDPPPADWDGSVAFMTK